MPYLSTHKSGDLVSRVTNDLNNIREFFESHFHQTLEAPLTVVAALGVMIWIDWRLTLISFIVTPIVFYISTLMNKPVQKLTKDKQEALGEVNTVAQDSIQGYIEVKSFNLYKTLAERFNVLTDKSVAKDEEIAKIQSTAMGVSLLNVIVPVLCMIGFGTWFVIRGEMTVGWMLVFVNVSNHIMNGSMNAIRIVGNLRKAAGSAERVFELWDIEGERQDGKIYELIPEKPILSLKNVYFGYVRKSVNGDGNEKEEKVELFNGLNLDIRKGETVALVGRSGCGKSTLLRLITGLYPPDDGEILYGGININKWNLDGLRTKMAMVSQDTYLYPDSIYTNIACGAAGIDIEINDDMIKKAAHQAGIAGFIEDLPEKYQTSAGERGVRLSGGQRQRIAIARAILKDAEVLMLDEPTSALDVESEKGVQKALDVLMKGRTSIIIAHRLSTIINVDRIIVIDNGTVVEEGTHNELINKGGVYYNLYNSQTEGEKEEKAV